MAGFIDDVLFTPVSSGTGDFVVSAAVQGYMTPAQSGAANATVYCYRAESSDLSQWEVGFGTYTVGSVTLARSTVLYNSLGTTAKINFTATPQVGIVSLSKDLTGKRGQLWGLTLSTAGSSTSFGVAVGEAVDSTAIDLMVLGSAYTKTSGAWAVGTGNGSFDGTGTGPATNTNTWYHVFLIKRPDTGVVDLLTSLSATAPTLPANYTLFRRIGSLRTDAVPNWRAFTQIDDNFWWTVPTRDVNNSNIGTTATDATLNVPTGIVVDALIAGWVFITGAGSVGWFYPKFMTDQTVAYGTFGNVRDGGTGNGATSYLVVPTNTSGVIRMRGNAAGATVDIDTFGWVDRRNRLS